MKEASPRKRLHWAEVSRELLPPSFQRGGEEENAGRTDFVQGKLRCGNACTGEDGE